MYSSKKNVLETVALFKAHGISEVVLSPGSRNTPLIQCFASDPFFNCHTVVDERSAGFFALGIINKIGKPVAVCCTSGSALLNYGPAVAEAFYQELPLVVVSADRSPAWIGQMDGQTLPQPGVFGNLVRKSVQLPEVLNDEDLWHCNRLVNEAVNEALAGGPVHINIPISEPLFDFSVERLPEVRKVVVSRAKQLSTEDLGYYEFAISKAERVLIVIGQLPLNQRQIPILLRQFSVDNTFVVLTEHLGMTFAHDFITNFDALISSWTKEDAPEFVPDLLITVGGHIVSKQLKQWLRSNPPIMHWHVGSTDKMPDTYQHVTHFVQAEPVVFFDALKKGMKPSTSWYYRWILAKERIPRPNRELPFSDITVSGAFMEAINLISCVFIGNSSPVRNLQLYEIPFGQPVFCNRGTNGIEGTLSAACGFATVSDHLVYVLIGDLSFFYDLNILTHRPFPPNLRIMLINNGGGGIFKQLPGLPNSDIVTKYVSASHDMKAKSFVEAAGLRYYSASNYEELDATLEFLRSKEGDSAVVVEVFTEDAVNLEASKTYYGSLKNVHSKNKRVDKK